MTTKASTSNITTDKNQHEKWFSKFIDDINKNIVADKEKLESGKASSQTRAFYKSLIDGDIMTTMSLTRSTVSNGIIKKMVIAYLTLITERQVKLSKLAIDTSLNKILVWAEIRENDEKMEMELISIESIINGTFSNETGIYLDSIIVEDSDKLSVPDHYSPILLK